MWVFAGFFFVALLYSLVGFGGGSSYLAILVLVGIPFDDLPQAALICNLIVTIGGCWHFYRAGYFKFKNVIPFIITSVPMAYWGGGLLIDTKLFCLLLGVSLSAVAFRFLMPSDKFLESKSISWKQAWQIGPILGAVLGFLAGVVGIGGGIFLSPILLLMRWVNIKEAAASASFFIVVNSAAGLAGQWQKTGAPEKWVLPLALMAFLGGQIGSRMGAYKIPKIHLQKALAALVLYVAFKLLRQTL